MLPEDLLQLDQISLSNNAASKKRALEVIAELLAAGTNAPPAEAIYEKLLDRERLGSTGMNHGIALPHARIKGIHKPTGAFLQLSEGIDFDSMDGKPVDLVFGLLVPEQATEAHLELLAELAKLFNKPELCAQVRQATNAEQVLRLLNPPPLPDAASDHS
ncbi:MAG TPA: PTS sugar transporter subunit IIA [Thiolapillus brandeum]|uniref:PTS sugar transporter subunit IIA n=1 Tax=Thiolapillus brandeum TaxID=1076588 RepID=A0A831RXW2_9GAMM|nr:PTS sugar transporter subunit IIA [Thiolapillus brandeum]